MYLAVFIFVILSISGSETAFFFRLSSHGIKTYSRKASKSILYAGFGKPSKIQKNSAGGVSLPELNLEAKKYLQRHSNDVNAASAEYFRNQIRRFSHLQNSNKIKGRDEQSDERQTLADIDLQHETKVAAAWNTVALFLPLDYSRNKGKVDPIVDRRLTHISSAIIHTPLIVHKDHASLSESVSFILDIGCGDGCLLPYLKEAKLNNGASISLQGYRGLDISSEMIVLARERWKHIIEKNQFVIGSFPLDAKTLLLELKKSSMSHMDQGYTAIVFNGSLQFFQDTAQVLKDAADLLLPGGRLVLSHVNGANFVKDECQKNPGIAVRSMPNNISLDIIAHDIGLTVIRKKDMEFFKRYDVSFDEDDGKFYLVVLEKPM